VAETAARKQRRRKPREPEPAKASEVAVPAIRDRIKEFRRVPSAELQDNERNWRTHPYAQTKALDEILERVGIAGVCIAYHSERNGGKLTLIDGHERKGREADWPTVILDVTDEEADLLLLTYDPIGAMAGADADALEQLLEEASAGTPALEDLLRQLAADAGDTEGDGRAGVDERSDEAGPKEMELQTFEHYDYIVVLFRSHADWSQAKAKFGLEQEAFTLADGQTRKVGLGRVVDGARLLELLER
jgi:hypothetical protein